MSSLISQQKAVEKNKRYLFLGVEAAGILCTFAWSPIVGIPIMAMGAYFGWRWFEFRMKNGMRF
jgi:predicted negative regulator of RcsB-dependent stress response